MKYKSLRNVLLTALFLAWAPLIAQQRPPLIGLSHIALFTRDIEASRAFYKGFLGFEEPFSLSDPKGTLQITWIKINDRQSVELFPQKEADSDRLYQIAIDTENAEALRAYLTSRGVKAPPKVTQGRIGNLNFSVKDPDGHTVEFVQRMPEGRTRLDEGKHMPETRLSNRMPHVGIMVGDLAKALAFYVDILGCKEIWRGSRDEKVLNWVHVKLPEGDDFIELMLYDRAPDSAQRGVMHHLCLETPDMAETERQLKSRTLPPGCKETTPMRVGINRKRQINCYDPDGTRVEFMEPKTADGQPAPASKAPAPR